MLIINADDWGRSKAETDAALLCFNEKRITSVTAMLFMEDSARAAEIAKDANIDVGLHLNLSQQFTCNGSSSLLKEYHNRIVHYLMLNKYALLFYNPLLRKQFQYVYQAQLEEFQRLYEKEPTHIDGHHHLHLCTNMLIARVIQKRSKVRRSFSFWPGEKGSLNIMYRNLVDRWLAAGYILTDYFFSISQVYQLEQLKNLSGLAKVSNVELMTHPIDKKEYAFLMSDDYLSAISKIENGTYTQLKV